MSNVRSAQAPSGVVVVRPHHFMSNPETAGDNAFQRLPTDADPAQIAKEAFAEVSNVIDVLRNAGIEVQVFEDEEEGRTPDSVFPNNWFSTHAGGHVAVYPMYSENRRLERRMDVIEMLKAEYRVQDVIDYSGLEPDGLFLEGTGAMVLDHIERIAYVCESHRANPVALERFATHFNFEPMSFVAKDSAGRPIYHTNVLMCIGTDFALIGSAMIADNARRDVVLNRLRETKASVIELSAEQIEHFAGNAIELQGPSGRLLALSQTAFESLSSDQIAELENYVQILPIAIPTIELAGGSIRCMLAGIHLSKR